MNSDVFVRLRDQNYVSEENLEDVLEETKVEDYIEGESEVSEVSETIVSKGYSLGDLEKIERLCSVLSACRPSERDRSFKFYKEREKAILEMQSEIFDDIDVTERLTRTYGELAKFVKDEDEEEALDLFERKMELLNDILKDEVGSDMSFVSQGSSLYYSYHEFAQLCEEMANKCDREKEMEVLEKEVKWLERARENFELPSSEQFSLEKSIFHSSGKLGRFYLERYFEKGSEDDFEKGSILKDKEIQTGLELVHKFEDFVDDKDICKIKKRIMYGVGYSSRSYKRRAMEVENEGSEEEAKQLYEEARAYKEMELDLLKGESIKDCMDESKRYTYLIEGLSTLVTCHQKLGLDDTPLLKEMIEYSEELPDSVIEEKEGLLHSLEFATHLLRDKKEGNEYDYEEKNIKYSEMLENY